MAAALLMISGAAFAQQQSIFSMYRQNMNIVNPAYAGVDGETVLALSYRDQWTGVPNAPLTQAVSFGTTVGNNLGIGLSVVNDRNFVEKETFAGIDFSYKLQMNYNTNLYFGLKAGGNFYSVNTSGLETYADMVDPALANYSSFDPNAGVGLLWKSEKYYVSFSLPRIFSTARAKNDDGYAVMATDRPHMYLSGGYDFDLQTNTPLVLKPSVMVSYVNNAPVSVDFNTMLQINNIFEIGASYRTDKAFAAMANFTVANRFMFGYAYEMSTNTDLASTKNTNELLLRFKFN